MAAAPEPAEPDPCPEPPAHRLSVVELDRELDSRSELVRPEPLRRRHGRAVGACACPGASRRAEGLAAGGSVGPSDTREGGSGPSDRHL